MKQIEIAGSIVCFFKRPLHRVASIGENTVRTDDGRSLPLSRSRRSALLNTLAVRMGAGA